MQPVGDGPLCSIMFGCGRKTAWGRPILPALCGELTSLLSSVVKLAPSGESQARKGTGCLSCRVICAKVGSN